MSETQLQQTSRAPLGALSRITPAHVRAALTIPKGGRVYDLGVEICEGMPPGSGVNYVTAFHSTPEGTGTGGHLQSAAEVIVGSLHSSTHIDGLSHVQSNGRIFGGDLARDSRDDRGLKKFGIETVLPIFGRCVVVDVARLHDGVTLPVGYEIPLEELKNACETAGVSVKDGDTVLVRTGRIRDYMKDPPFYARHSPGLGRAAAIWLYEQGMAVLGTDTPSTDPLPFPDATSTVHHAMLVERGVHIIENVNLEDLATDNVHEALFVCLPLKFTGGTASWVRPVAIA
jgi:kynurenine formamidase